MGYEAAECLEPANEVVRGHEVSKARLKLLVSIIMGAFDGRVLDCSVHVFGLAIAPWVVWVG